MMFLAFGCTTDNSGNTTVVPLAPTNLSATVVSTTQVKLNWTDNATNEAGYKIQRKTGNGNFTDIASTGADITTHDDLGLTANTSYTYRVYAFNNAGNSIEYSNEVMVTTSGSAVNSPSVTIGTQVWTSKNLDVSTYRNGDPIPQVTNQTQWANLTTGAWCWYNNDSVIGQVYGKLYNWYAVNDPRGLAPSGWHIPTDAEWTTLTDFLGGESVAGGKMKTTGTQYWDLESSGTTNSSGFSGLPGGLRDHRDRRSAFGGIGDSGNWWSSSSFDITTAWQRSMLCNLNIVSRNNNEKTGGSSVRLVKD